MMKNSGVEKSAEATYVMTYEIGDTKKCMREATQVGAHCIAYNEWEADATGPAGQDGAVFTGTRAQLVKMMKLKGWDAKEIAWQTAHNMKRV